MKSLRCISIAGFIFSAFLSAARAQQSPSDEVSVVVTRYKTEFDALAAAEENSLAPVKAAHVKELEKLRDGAKAKGDLNAVLDFEAAIQAAIANQTPPIPKVAAASLNAARENFVKNKTAALRLHDPKRQRLQADYSRALTDLEQKFTRKGQLDAATLARDAKLSIPGVAVDLLVAMIGPREMKEGYVVVKAEGAVKSEMSFQPPVEIEYVFKTDSQVRFGYACNQMILNWEVNGAELRVDGDPANGQHKSGAGRIPTKQIVTVKQTVQPDQMILSVDGRERAVWKANFAGINQPISITAARGATVQIKQVLVRKLR